MEAEHPFVDEGRVQEIPGVGVLPVDPADGTEELAAGQCKPVREGRGLKNRLLDLGRAPAGGDGGPDLEMGTRPGRQTDFHMPEIEAVLDVIMGMGLSGAVGMPETGHLAFQVIHPLRGIVPVIVGIQDDRGVKLQAFEDRVFQGFMDVSLQGILKGFLPGGCFGGGFRL
jgi:hypothetical protein